MRTTLRFIILIILMGSGKLAYATHIIGGDLTYTCVSPQVYNFTLTVYSECGSTAELEDFYPIHYFSASRGVPKEEAKSFIVQKEAEEEVAVFCPTVITNCNGGSARGIKKIIYSGVVDLRPYGTATDWTFYWIRAARSEEIHTLVFPDGEDFYVQAMINSVDAPCNSSVVFEASSIINACVGEEIRYNQLARDPNGDNLRFRFSTPKSSHEVDVVFRDGFDSAAFISMSGPATLNANTGDLTFTPTAELVGITDILVEEYRGGKLIGSVTRGIQVTGMDCANESPELSDFIGEESSTISVCSGETIELYINGSDPDGDEITMTGSGDKAGVFAVFTAAVDTITPPVGRFFWTTRANNADAGTYYFQVTLTDDACPRPQSTTKTYTIEVMPRPQFLLGFDQTTTCDVDILLNPTISEGAPPYSYAWSTGAETSSIEVNSGYYGLTVTDANGCSHSDDISINNGLTALFEDSLYCTEYPTYFRDLSESVDSEITEWRWDFGDGHTATGPDPSHQYAEAGDYDVRLTVRDNLGCEAEHYEIIRICDPPEAQFTYLDSCSVNPTTFQDLTAHECNLARRTWIWGDGTYTPYPGPTDPYGIHSFDAPGDYLVEMIVESASGCADTASMEVTIYESPEINIIQDDHYLNCNKPDTVLTTEIITAGNGALTYFWHPTRTAADSLAINGSGDHSVTATDELGCYATDQLSVLYPIYARFRYDAFCEPGDEINFEDLSLSLDPSTSIVSWDWDFGDGNTDSDQHPSHLYGSYGDYNVALSVTNGNGCMSTRNWPVYNTYFSGEMSVDSSVCLTNAMAFNGPAPHAGGSHIDSLKWDFGNGAAISTASGAYYYPQTGEYEVKLTMHYNGNRQGNVIISEGCVAEFKDSVVVNPEYKFEFAIPRFCVNDSVLFDFERTRGDLSIPSVEAEWTLTDLADHSAETYNELNPVHFFPERKSYRLALQASDSLGCSFSAVKNFRADEVEMPEFTTDEVLCAKAPATFYADFKDTYENITNVIWTFGDGDTTAGFYQRPMETQHIYKEGGSHSITLTALNSFTGCYKTVEKELYIIPPPIVEFTIDSVCVNEPYQFANHSTAPFGEIVGFSWIVDSVVFSNEAEPAYSWPRQGDVPVSLAAVNNAGCSDTLTQLMHILQAPVADFTIDAEYFEANTPIPFIDNSTGFVEEYFWHFGDGAISHERDPVHTYDSIDVYTIMHIVENIDGCSDTTVADLSLKAFLDLPTAFTPNNDRLNDNLKLIYYNIKELYEYKIYNRWGEVVFDAGSNPDAIWDGTVNGRPQDTGVYVVYVKALGANDIPFNFKKNVTLIKK